MQMSKEDLTLISPSVGSGVTEGSGAAPATGLYFHTTGGVVDTLWLNGVQVADLSGVPAAGSVGSAQLNAAIIDAAVGTPSARSLLTAVSADNLHAPTAQAVLTAIASAIAAQQSQRFVTWDAAGPGTQPSVNGLGTNDQGTKTSRALAFTNFFTRQRRQGYVSATTANASAGLQGNQQFNGTDGYTFRAVFGIQAYNAGHQYEVGMSGFYSAATLPGSETSALTMYANPGDTHWKVHGGDSTMSTPIDLGASFPVATSAVDMYDVTFVVAPGGTTATYTIVRLNTGDVATGTVTRVPSPTVTQGVVCIGSNLATAAAASVDIARMSVLTAN